MSDYFECDYCRRHFIRKYNLKIHIENYHLKSQLVCDICDHKFTTIGGLQLHYSRGHNKYDQPFPECDICGRVFTRKQNIISHMKTIHQNASIIKCNLCDRSFLRPINLKQHMNTLHKPDRLVCSDCHNVFYDKHSLVVHMQTSGCQGPSIACPHCTRVYCDKRSLKRHLRFHDGQGQFQCDYCPKVYTLNQSLSRHIRAMHGAVARRAKQAAEEFGQGRCEECGKIFKREYDLRQHIKSDHSFSAFYKYCKLSLTAKQSKYGSVKHGLEDFKNISDDSKLSTDSETSEQSDSYRCEYCVKTFTNIFELKDHMRVFHNKEYGFSTCNVCFSKFFSKESRMEHSKICHASSNVKKCSYCDKLFTHESSLEFHMRIFHPQTQIADSNITSTNNDDENEDVGSHSQSVSVQGILKCKHCSRIYFSERSLKHHLKLKHTTEEEVHCELCGKTYNNRFYLAAHIKGVHNEDSWAKCDYCDKAFRGKRNIRRHIEFTHLGRKRYKCIECETLFKEKRSLRKHVRRKHADSNIFPECHLCHKRFESAKSCKIHLKLLHSFNMNTYPCHLCSVSLSSSTSLETHLTSKHWAEDEIYKCEKCGLVFQGHEKFQQHNALKHVNVVQSIKVKTLPRCILCMKDFSTRKTLKRHISKFHTEFNVEELANFGTRRRTFVVECDECIRSFDDVAIFANYLKQKQVPDAVIFKCEVCKYAYNVLEYSIQRYKIKDGVGISKMILSELCTAEMSEDDIQAPDTSGIEEHVEPESTTDIKIECPNIKQEPEPQLGEAMSCQDDKSRIRIKEEPLDVLEDKTEDLEEISCVKMEFKEEPLGF